MSLSFKEAMLMLTKNDLIELIKLLLNEKPKLTENVLEWLREKKNDTELLQEPLIFEDVELNDNLMMLYWNKAQQIISKFNKYGGGPEEDEEKAFDYLRKVTDFVGKNPVSQEAKEEFIEECFIEYNEGNSGMNDFLLEVINDICELKEDWEFVVANLNENPSSWHEKLIEDIQRKYLS